ncbi:MAG: AAA family ATPase [Bacteroidetes bacterium SB0662_bin_6]|nr:AAA family ATPase [Bacteroidetes bacterium SB0668_bin_1]MYE04592.1 AAA family ATPase [Bacteroidetes bacterium SB0662_bin_6]
MLKRVHIKGYKSLLDVEAYIEPLTVLFGPNAAGKSNVLDALQLLSRLGTSKTLKDAFDAPYRGKPLESFTMREGGLKELRAREHLTFSFEADLRLSDAVVHAVNQEIRDMRRPSGAVSPPENGKERLPQVHERDLRYRIEIEMLPGSGILRVADESLAALNRKGNPTGKRKPFFGREGERIHLRLDGQAHPTYYDRYLDRSILSMPHYLPYYPHVAAARRELESWRFFCFDPRERMRTAAPLREVSHIGPMGEDLAAFLNTLKATDPDRLQDMEKALHALLPDIDGIDVQVNEFGEAELCLIEGSAAMSARMLSDGTLRMLGLLALIGAREAPGLVGLEEPENGIHPRHIQCIADLLKTQQALQQTQCIVTTHSPLLSDVLPDESLFAVSRSGGATRIDTFSTWGTLGRGRDIDRVLSDEY